jgi:putative transposase
MHVHLIRNSLVFGSWKDRKQIMPDLKAIYRAESAEAALDRLAEFEENGMPATRRSARAGAGHGSM